MEIIIFFQSLGDWLIPIAEFFTFLGFEEFYFTIMPAIYWCVNSIIGARLLILLATTTGLNEVLKLVFHSPRPFWVSTDVHALSSDTSFGIPSGHAQTTFAFWGTWAISIRKNWAWLIAGFLILMIGTSRLVLGVHFPIDVLLGWIFGGLLLWVFTRLEKPVMKWVNSQTVRGQVVTVISIAVAFLLIGNLTILMLNNFEMPTDWIENGTLAGTTPDPITRDGFTTAAGVFLGLSLGLIMMNQRGGFNPKGLLWKRILRYILGIVGALAIWAGLKAIFPSGEGLIPQTLRMVRYTSLGFWVAAAGPLVFMKLNLMEPATKE